METRNRIKDLLIKCHEIEDYEQRMYLLQAADKLFMDNYLSKEYIDEFIKQSLIIINIEDISEDIEAPMEASRIYMREKGIDGVFCVYNKTLDILVCSDHKTLDNCWFLLPDIKMGLATTNIDEKQSTIELIKYEME